MKVTHKSPRERIKAKIRAKVVGTKERPRLSVFRSHKHIYAQIVNDEKGVTLVASSDLKMDAKTKKTKRAYEVGKAVAKKALDAKIKKVVFDRSGYKYHGRVKAVAEGARENKLVF
ncbi:50S ribosomal protein L18 [Candidatus Parcubacteria bacterium]|nr:50S ribosomal protein L18 [Patescibacteria group bacterium]MBU4381136.1 50S ribosomal protein L18 [Patescibacteria group bacterium]MCG2689141.1 50S ribosomal protein L18 [Candidatus Parcubacteria bacterium]